MRLFRTYSDMFGLLLRVAWCLICQTPGGVNDVIFGQISFSASTVAKVLDEGTYECPPLFIRVKA